MISLNKSKLAIATSLIAAAALAGCGSNQSADTNESSDSRLISMKNDKQQENRGADQSAVYMATERSRSADEQASRANTEQNVIEQEIQQDNTQTSMEDVSPISKTVAFEFDSAELTSEAKRELKNALDNSTRSVPMEAEIVGYTDSAGPESYNQQLSEERAQAVRDYLADLDANIEDWQVEGRGEASPTASNETDNGRAENRRVSITLKPLEQQRQASGF